MSFLSYFPSGSCEFLVVVWQYLHWEVHGATDSLWQRGRLQPQPDHFRVSTEYRVTNRGINKSRNVQYWESPQQEVDAEPRSGWWQRPLPALHVADQGPGGEGHSVCSALIPRREPRPGRSFKANIYHNFYIVDCYSGKCSDSYITLWTTSGRIASNWRNKQKIIQTNFPVFISSSWQSLFTCWNFSLETLNPSRNKWQKMFTFLFTSWKTSARLLLIEKINK